MGYEPFEVRMRLAAPVVIGCQRQPYPVHFDGFLASVYVFLQTGRRAVAEELAREIVAGLPLAKHEFGGEWFYCASAWELVGAGVTADAAVLCPSWKHWVRFGTEVKKPDYWNDQQEIYRAVRTRMVVAVASEAVFRARGDASAVSAALEEYHRRCGMALGPRTAAGYGVVSGFEVRRAADDRSVWREEVSPSGAIRVPARHIPLEEARRLGLTVRFVRPGAVRPPYWGSPHVLCAAPEPWSWYPLRAADPVPAGKARTMEELLDGMRVDEGRAE